jgi:hypothetical protein
MHNSVTRRGFVKSSLLATAALPLGLRAQPASRAESSPAPGTSRERLPNGRIGGEEFSRLMLGGNLVAGHAHARDLSYVTHLMRGYNTEAKIRETLELAESQGITTMNTWVMDNNTHLFNHWKHGGKMKWIAQVRLDAQRGFDQARRAIDEGATGVHITGDAAERLLGGRQFDKIPELLQFIHTRKRLAGVAAHDLQVIVECEKLKVDADFYQATLHTHDYFSAPRPDDLGVVGAHDNSWCRDPQAVVDFMAGVRKPWIAFKILAAGAIAPRAAFPYAFTSGADFILVGMFDWQIVENATLARRVLGVVGGPNSKRTRTWCA